MSKTRKWLADIRGDRTHQEVANAANIDRAYYTQIENGTRNPSVNTAKKIAGAMGFNWTIFFDDECGEVRQFESTGTTG